MYEKWEGLEIETKQFKNTIHFVVVGFDVLEEELDEDFSLTGSMIINPFKKPFEKEIDEWNDSLLLILNVIEEWRRL